jgi:hypothetical protein
MLALVVVTAAACGSSAGGAPPSTSYPAGVHAAGARISTSLQSLVQVVGISLRFPVAPTAGRQSAAILTKTEARLAAAQKQLAALHPPAKAKAGQAQLVVGTVALQKELRPLIVKLAGGYLVTAQKLLSLPSVATIQAAAAKLKAAGYPTGI